jgi:hypothetical protein
MNTRYSVEYMSTSAHMKKPTKKTTTKIQPQGKTTTINELAATVDNLAVMVAKGFERVDARFTQMDTRLDRIENLLIRGLENRTDKIEDDIRVSKTTVERLASAK